MLIDGKYKRIDSLDLDSLKLLIESVEPNTNFHEFLGKLIEFKNHVSAVSELQNSEDLKFYFEKEHTTDNNVTVTVDAWKVLTLDLSKETQSFELRSLSMDQDDFNKLKEDKRLKRTNAQQHCFILKTISKEGQPTYDIMRLDFYFDRRNTAENLKNKAATLRKAAENTLSEEEKSMLAKNKDLLLKKAASGEQQLIPEEKEDLQARAKAFESRASLKETYERNENLRKLFIEHPTFKTKMTKLKEFDEKSQTRDEVKSQIEPEFMSWIDSAYVESRSKKGVALNKVANETRSTVEGLLKDKFSILGSLELRTEDAAKKAAGGATNETTEKDYGLWGDSSQIFIKAKMLIDQFNQTKNPDVIISRLEDHISRFVEGGESIHELISTFTKNGVDIKALLFDILQKEFVKEGVDISKKEDSIKFLLLLTLNKKGYKVIFDKLKEFNIATLPSCLAEKHINQTYRSAEEQDFAVAYNSTRDDEKMLDVPETLISRFPKGYEVVLNYYFKENLKGEDEEKVKVFINKLWKLAVDNNIAANAEQITEDDIVSKMRILLCLNEKAYQTLAERFISTDESIKAIVTEAADKAKTYFDESHITKDAQQLAKAFALSQDGTNLQTAVDELNTLIKKASGNLAFDLKGYFKLVDSDDIKQLLVTLTTAAPKGLGLQLNIKIRNDDYQTITLLLLSLNNETYKALAEKLACNETYACKVPRIIANRYLNKDYIVKQSSDEELTRIYRLCYTEENRQSALNNVLYSILNSTDPDTAEKISTYFNGKKTDGERLTVEEKINVLFILLVQNDIILKQQIPDDVPMSEKLIMLSLLNKDGRKAIVNKFIEKSENADGSAILPALREELNPTIFEMSEPLLNNDGKKDNDYNLEINGVDTLASLCAQRFVKFDNSRKFIGFKFPSFNINLSYPAKILTAFVLCLMVSAVYTSLGLLI